MRRKLVITTNDSLNDLYNTKSIRSVTTFTNFHVFQFQDVNKFFQKGQAFISFKKNGALHYKTKTTRCFCILIQSHNYLLNFSSAGEKLIDLLFCCIKGHIPNINSIRCQKRMFKFLL